MREVGGIAIAGYRWPAREVAMNRDRPRSAHASTDDHAVLLRLQARDEAALAALYDRYGGLVFTVALRVVGDRELAREVLQDTFLRCWDGAESYRAQRGSVPGWLMGIARNRAIDVVRGRQHQDRLREREPLPLPGSHGEPSHPDSTEVIATAHTVRAALTDLSDRQRQVIELAYYGGFSQTEIARRLHEPLGTVKTRMRDGMERLRQRLYPAIAPDGEERDRRD